jgi:glycosyltransferase involved in cell wall biosynthesis
LSTSRDVSVCIVQPNIESVSETFLGAHARLLPATVTVIQGFFPHIGERPVLSPAPACRAYRKLCRLVSGKSVHDEATEAYARVLREIQASVVLAEYGPTGVHVLQACLANRIPLVVHFHGYDLSRRSVLAEHATSYPRLFREADALIAVSRPMRERLISMGAPPSKIHYNPCGVDCRVFTGADPANAPPVLLAVGRFVEKKAPHLTIAAFAEARRSCPEASLRMIGDGPLLARCHDLVHALGLQDAVTLLGAQSPETVRGEMRRARAFVQHSIVSSCGDSEGMPVSILEAGACGLPVVATRHAGIPEAVVDGETGLLVEERDVAGMATAIRRVLGDRDLAGSLGHAARLWIAAHFNMEDRIDLLWSILCSCLAPPGPPKARATGFSPASWPDGATVARLSGVAGATVVGDGNAAPEYGGDGYVG